MSDTPIAEGSHPELLASGEDGRNPPRGKRSKDGYLAFSGMRESTKYGILLYLLQSSAFPLSSGQVLWIVYRSRKFSEAELLRAGLFAETLAQDEKVRSRHRRDIEKLYTRVPSLNPKRLPEKRTIGIGYRDKGVLRPLHQQRERGVESFWDEDIRYLLPLSYDVCGKWITSEEVKSLIGENLLYLAIQQAQKQL